MLSPRGGDYHIRQRLISCALAPIFKGWSRQLRRAGIAIASHFCDITATGFWDDEILCDILFHFPEGTSELMCHPGIVDNALRQTPTRLLEPREGDYRALTQPASSLHKIWHSASQSSRRCVWGGSWSKPHLGPLFSGIRGCLVKLHSLLLSGRSSLEVATRTTE